MKKVSLSISSFYDVLIYVNSGDLRYYDQAYGFFFPRSVANLSIFIRKRLKERIRQKVQHAKVIVKKAFFFFVVILLIIPQIFEIISNWLFPFSITNLIEKHVTWPQLQKRRSGCFGALLVYTARGRHDKRGMS